MNAQISGRMFQDANKVAYLVKAYPEKTMADIIKLFMIASIDINCAIWAAVELGFIREVDEETGFTQVINEPVEWDFGTDVQALEDAFTYAMNKVNADENDLEENFISDWTNGYFPQDALIAIKHLIEKGVVVEYELMDGESKYLFYTLNKNAGKNWGAKQFKKNPLTGEDQTDDAESEEKAKE